jgi:antitoxin component of RelBE/YafQ-DinJ toxin-antitoxin module
MSSKAIAYIRLKEEDKALLMKIAEYYDVSESDAVKIAVKHLAKELGLLSS